jgi:translation initiation factor 4A
MQVIPALQHVYVNIAQAAMSMNEGGHESAPKGIQALILTATIDQAGQAHRMCLGLGQALGITSSLAVGQGDISSELASLSANPPHILVGTPQKLLDLLAIRSIPVDRLSLLVIDEMDQLIARNLSEYVNNLAKLLPPPISSPSTSRDRSPVPGSSGMKSFDVGSPTRPSQERQTAIFSCTV